MFAGADVLEWEAKGDSLRRARRFADAIEAYRTALRHCFQLRGPEMRSCNEIREKIRLAEVEGFEAFWAGRADLASGTVDEETRRLAQDSGCVEHAAARLWACGAVGEAERLIEASVRGGGNASGEFLDRVADRWRQRKQNPEFVLWLRACARRLRGDPSAADREHGMFTSAGCGPAPKGPVSR